MPNDCYNHLTVTDLTVEEIVQLRQALLSGKFPEGFAPEPDWKMIPVNGELPTVIVKVNDDELKWADGSSDDRWYDWRYTHWGTKWHAYEVSVDDGDGIQTPLAASYCTAWKPLNKECVAKVSAAFPAATFCFKYHESGNGFVGVTLARGGVAVAAYDDYNVVYSKWGRDNIGRIAALAREYDNKDEDSFSDAGYELWMEDESDCVKAFQDTMIPGLMRSLEEKAETRKQFGYIGGDRKMNFTEFFKKRLGESD